MNINLNIYMKLENIMHINLVKKMVQKYNANIGMGIGSWKELIYNFPN